MHTMDRLREILELDLVLFGGVPETAQPMYPADWHTHIDHRTTRAGLPNRSEQRRDIGKPARVVSRIRWEYDANAQLFHPVRIDADEAN